MPLTYKGREEDARPHGAERRAFRSTRPTPSRWRVRTDRGRPQENVDDSMASVPTLAGEAPPSWFAWYRSRHDGTCFRLPDAGDDSHGRDEIAHTGEPARPAKDPRSAGAIPTSGDRGNIGVHASPRPACDCRRALAPAGRGEGDERRGGSARAGRTGTGWEQPVPAPGEAHPSPAQARQPLALHGNGAARVVQSPRPHKRRSSGSAPCPGPGLQPWVSVRQVSACGSRRRAG